MVLRIAFEQSQNFVRTLLQCLVDVVCGVNWIAIKSPGLCYCFDMASESRRTLCAVQKGIWAECLLIDVVCINFY